MKTLFATTLMSACLVFASSAMAQDTMKKNDGMMKKDMTMQDCKDHMAMVKKDGTKKDAASMKMDKTCTDMMNKDGMSKDGMTKGAMPASAPK